MPDGASRRADAAPSRLIVNADDFGQSPGINAGILRAHDEGIVTSASLMVRWPAAAGAVAASRQRPRLGLGLHIDLGEWAHRGGAWMPLYAVVPIDNVTGVRGEAERQLDAFRRLVGRDPTHLDSHQHLHRVEPLRSVLAEIAGRLGVPLRGLDGTVQYRGDFYGQTALGEPLPGTVGVTALQALLRALPPGWVELGCHPAEAVEFDTMYRVERRLELTTLCDAGVRATVVELGIELCSFADFLARATQGQMAVDGDARVGAP
jgi:predicted glycoside hydrolase/deacetylase ChbG (UPF0249 family)